jgi:hypothetical protein
MAQVTVAAGATGSDIVLAATTIFAVESGSIDLSTDAGTTFVTFHSNEKVIVSSGLTVRPKNTRSGAAIFSHMSL